MITATCPPFTLTDSGGVARSFPTGRPALLCFVKEDCPTCGLSMPLIELAGRSFGGQVDIWCIGQDAEGNALLEERHNLSIPMLDDSALAVSFAYDLDTVPTIILTDADGAEQRRFVGFGREDWRALFQALAGLSGISGPEVDWDSYPDSRPGCGSKSVEPGIYERLAAEAAGDALRARRIEIAPLDDPFEFMFDQGFSDGLPLVPPTPERVMRMLSGTRRDPQSVVATVPPNMAPATVEKVAINAVMAGCKPEYMPVIIAALEAVCTDAFNMHGVLATTHFPTPVLIVNGPIRHQIGMNMRMNALGQGNRANATIGRALQLIVRNVGGGRPGDIDRAVLGQPGKYTMCFPEYEERSNWEPLHFERGFAPDDSTVTVFAGGAPNAIVDQLSRGAASLAVSYAHALSAASNPKHYGYGEILVVVPPEHVDTIAKDGWSKEQFRTAIQEASRRPARDLLRGAGGSDEGLTQAAAERLGLDTLVPKFRDPAGIKIVVAGGEGGKFGAYFAGWASGPTGSMMTTRKIEF